MRTVLILWFIPVFLFWGWYALSVNDIHFGFFMFTRAFHDHLFQIYGNILHLPPEDVPEKIAWVFAIDTVIVLAIAALRWYKKWLPQLSHFVREKLFGQETQQHRLSERLNRYSVKETL